MQHSIGELFTDLLDSPTNMTHKKNCLKCQSEDLLFKIVLVLSFRIIFMLDFILVTVDRIKRKMI